MDRLLCYGDSNTFGWDPRSPLGGRYSRPWVSILQELTGIECVNLGFPGLRIPENRRALAGLERVLAESGNSALFIMLGTNNAVLPPRESPEKAAEKMDALLEILQEDFPALPLFLLGVPPVLLPEHGFESWADEMNLLCAKAAQKHSVAFFDPLPLKPPIAFDGIHLTEEGHERLAEGLCKSGLLY